MLLSPRAISRRTSVSRSVSLSSETARDRGLRANSSMSRRVTLGEERAALGDDPDRRGEPLLRSVLEQEAARARAQRVVHDLVEVERGQHQDPRRVLGRGDRLGGGDAVHDGHPDVHEDDVRGSLRAQRDGRLAVGSLAHHVDVRLGAEDHLQAGADQRLVVGQDDADHETSVAYGSHAVSASKRPWVTPEDDKPGSRG